MNADGTLDEVSTSSTVTVDVGQFIFIKDASTVAQQDITYSHDGNSSSTTQNPHTNTYPEGQVISLSSSIGSFQSPVSGYAFDRWVLVSGPGSIINPESLTTAEYTVGTGAAEIRATFKAVQSSSGSGSGDVTIDNQTWATSIQIDVSAGQWSGGFTPYNMTNNQNGDPIIINMDSSAFIIGASSADTIETWLRLPDTDSLIKMTYSKTYTVNSTGNTLLTMTIGGITYTYDFTTSGNASNQYNSPFDMTKL